MHVAGRACTSRCRCRCGAQPRTALDIGTLAKGAAGIGTGGKRNSTDAVAVARRMLPRTRGLHGGAGSGGARGARPGGGVG